MKQESQTQWLQQQINRYRDRAKQAVQIAAIALIAVVLELVIIAGIVAHSLSKAP